MLQQRFIDAAVDFACRGKRLVLSEIAKVVGVEETRPYKWRRDPRFVDSMATQLTAEHKYLSIAARTALYQLAIAGNLPAFDRIRAVERDIEQLANPSNADGDNPANFGGGTHVHIHAIPERQPMSALPPLLVLPAQPGSAATTSPAK